jgi:cobalamin biosynthesis Mg chelatase CobN
VTVQNQQAKGKSVKVSIVESFTKEVAPKDLEATLRMEYRSKLLNPKWAKAMAAQGSGGAYEISQRMTALVGAGERGVRGVARDHASCLMRSCIIISSSSRSSSSSGSRVW